MIGAAVLTLFKRGLVAFGRQARQAFRRDQIGQTIENVARILAVLVAILVIGSFVLAFVLSGVTGSDLVGLALIKTVLTVGMIQIPIVAFLGLRVFAQPLN
jgi:hypothetical protein